MDGKRFDRIAIAWATPTRRAIVGLPLAGVLAAAFGLPAAANAQGSCGSAGTLCRVAEDCCSQRCRKKPGRSRGKCRPCPSGTFECAGGCQKCCVNADCPSGQTCCQNNLQCRDVRNDPRNCGRCKGVCPTGAVCANGDCGLTCNTVGQKCFEPDCFCGNRVDPNNTGQKLVCSTVSPGNCTFVKTCNTDADCDPGTQGFRKICVSGLCPGKKVCADPCA